MAQTNKKKLAYIKSWRSKNKDKVAESNKRYWLKQQEKKHSQRCLSDQK